MYSYIQIFRCLFTILFPSFLPFSVFFFSSLYLLFYLSFLLTYPIYFYGDFIVNPTVVRLCMYSPIFHPSIHKSIYASIKLSIHLSTNLLIHSSLYPLLFSPLLYCSLLIASLLFTSHLVSLICFSSHLISLTLFSSLVFFSSKDAAPQDVGTPPITTGTETTPGGGRNKYGSMNPINASATSFMQGSGQPGKKGLHSSKVRMTLKLFHMHVSLS